MLSSGMKIMLIALLIVLAIGLGPMLLIWSLNVLFGLGIAYGFKTWLAAFLLGAMFNVNNVNNAKNKE